MGTDKEILFNENNELKVSKEALLENLNHADYEKSESASENKKLKITVEEVELNLNRFKEKNKFYEIDNSKLKDEFSNYIIDSKKNQEKTVLLEKSNSLNNSEIDKKLKFYQDENVRLSSELLAANKTNEAIKINLNYIEIEKGKISNKIKELSKSIEEKTNIVSTAFAKESSYKLDKNVDNLNDTDQKNLDEVISRIFSKI